jgi:hypothetical protein
MRQALVLLCTVCALALPSCKKPTRATTLSPQPQSTVSPHKLSPVRNYEAGPARFDVCGLLKSEEIQAIAGSLIEQSKSSARSNGSLRVSQCVYVARQPNQSISLVITEADPVVRNKRSAKDFWHERFGRYQKRSEESEEKEKPGRDMSESEEEREGRPPRKIERLGDDAYWTAGSLYVLHNETFLRLSVGGSDPEEAKLEHSKALAEIALKRF